MLAELHIANLGVIEDLDLELHPGLNVLTGETGAGKTLVTLGLALALGTRAQAAHVRNGSVRARGTHGIGSRRQCVAAGSARATRSSA